MGKGDRRTKRGKVWAGTHGKLRSASKEKLRASKAGSNNTSKKAEATS